MYGPLGCIDTDACVFVLIVIVYEYVEMKYTCALTFVEREWVCLPEGLFIYKLSWCKCIEYMYLFIQESV